MLAVGEFVACARLLRFARNDALRHREANFRHCEAACGRGSLGLLRFARNDGRLLRFARNDAPPRGLQPIPQAQIAAELAFVVLELGMRLVGLSLRLHGAVTHILHTQGGRDDQHFVQALALTRRQNHATHPRVQRQLGQLLADGREAVVFQHRAEFIEQLKTVGDGFGTRSLQKRKVRHIAQAQRHHAQYHPCQRAAQNFRFGEAWAAVEIFLVIQANAYAIRHTSTASCTLIGRGLADGFHQELLHLAAKTVALDPRHSSVHHIPDARHCERGFGHVGGQNDARYAPRLKHLFLFGLREACKQGQHLHMPCVGVVRQVAAQVFCGIADFSLPRQKHQDVATRRTGPQLVHRVGDGVTQLMLAAFLPRAVAHFHGEGAARHHQHRGRSVAAGEMLGKAVGVDGGRGDDDLQVGAARQDLLEVAQQKVDVQTALVGLVDDQGVIGLQKRIGLRLGQQDAVGHQLDGGVTRQLVLKPHFETHHLAQRGFQLLGDALGHRGGSDAAGLGVTDDLAALAMGVFGVRARVLLRKIGI